MHIYNSVQCWWHTLRTLRRCPCPTCFQTRPAAPHAAAARPCPSLQFQCRARGMALHPAPLAGSGNRVPGGGRATRGGRRGARCHGVRCVSGAEGATLYVDPHTTHSCAIIHRCQPLAHDAVHAPARALTATQVRHLSRQMQQIQCAPQRIAHTSRRRLIDSVSLRRSVSYARTAAAAVRVPRPRNGAREHRRPPPHDLPPPPSKRGALSPFGRRSPLSPAGPAPPRA